MTSLLKPQPLRSRTGFSPPQGQSESAPCSSLTMLTGIGLVACSLDSGHERDRPHQEIDDSTGQILTEWLSPPSCSEPADGTHFRQVA